MHEIDKIDDFLPWFGKDKIANITLQQLDLVPFEQNIIKILFSNCLFLGCKMTPEMIAHLYQDNYIFPEIKMPYNIYPKALYTKESLFEGFNPSDPDSYELTPDKKIYNYYIRHAKDSHNIKETLAKRLHDHSITDALQEFVHEYDSHKVVAIMGGHGMSRNSESYKQIVNIAGSLTLDGYLLISGGGPGAMEATHVGAWLAGYTDDVLEDALSILSEAPLYTDKRWLSTSFDVLNKYPTSPYKSLGIPTWHYGHEPPTPFATHIAKYFANSVREEGLLAIAKGGVIFTPGSAGTMQEIFQDLAQNHYQSFGVSSPMVFLDKKYWTEDRPIFPVLDYMVQNGKIKNIDLAIYDEPDMILHHIRSYTEKVQIQTKNQ
jgi:predicted Rossmann-fold nucleotide-binding protein